MNMESKDSLIKPIISMLKNIFSLYNVVLITIITLIISALLLFTWLTFTMQINKINDNTKILFTEIAKNQTNQTLLFQDHEYKSAQKIKDIINRLDNVTENIGHVELLKQPKPKPKDKLKLKIEDVVIKEHN